MTITRTNPTVSGSIEGSTARTQRHGVRIALLIAVVALVLAGIAGGAFVRYGSQPSPAVASSGSDPFSPYAVGGSVYNEQVPSAAGANPYAVGGSVYNEQVPRQSDDLANPYAEGGSVYREQVPSAADAH